MKREEEVGGGEGSFSKTLLCTSQILQNNIVVWHSVVTFKGIFKNSLRVLCNQKRDL